VSTSKTLSIGSMAVLVAIAACAKSEAATNNDDFSRDLQLASSSVDLAKPAVNPANLNALETQPTSAPQHATVLKKNSTGNKIVRSDAPTRRAAPTTEVASTDGMNMTQTSDSMPDPTATTEPVAQAPQTSVISVDPTGGNGAGDYGTDGNSGDGDGDYGRSGNGNGGIFGGGQGTGGGAVARGGGVGDGDNCERDGGVIFGGGYPRTARRPVYIPNPGGVSTGRFPTGRQPSGGMPTPGRTGARRRG